MLSPKKITFPGSLGESLAARLDLPPQLPRAYAVFAHCFTCSKDVFAASRVSAGLASHGIGVLRFDFTGLGHSDGEFANTNFTSNVADLLCAVDYLREHCEAPRILVGHSLGGAAVLSAGRHVPEADAIVTIGAPFEPAHVAHHFSRSLDEIRRKGSAEVRLGGRPFTVTQDFLDDIGKQKQETAIGSLGKALLVMHAPRDEIVGVSNAAEIFDAAKHPKSFVSLDNADHLLTSREDASYAAEVISAWSSRFVAGKDTVGPDSEPGQVRVSETGMGKFVQRISANGRHSLLADEPTDAGGDDVGPTPYDLLLAALGACSTMTMRLYAERKNLPLRHVEVTLSHERVHASDCQECETVEGIIERIKRIIRVEGNLDEASRASILKIADKCPVHRTLCSRVHIDTSFGD